MPQLVNVTHTTFLLPAATVINASGRLFKFRCFCDYDNKDLLYSISGLHHLQKARFSQMGLLFSVV